MRYAAVIACLLSLSACRDSAPNTQIVISVDTNYAVPSGLDAVAFKVEKQNAKGYDPPRHNDVQRLDGKNAPDLPLTLALTSVASGRPTVRVTVTGQRDGKNVTRARRSWAFARARRCRCP